MTVSPPLLHVRSFSNDQEVLDKCFYENNYQLRGHKEEKDRPIVVDIGAHAGYFTFCACAFGAKKIYCVEPYFPNFEMLLKNGSAIAQGDIVYHNFGISPSRAVYHFNHPEPTNGIFYDYANIEVENKDLGFERRSVIRLSDFLSNFMDEDYIDLLKISIGYSELDILETCPFDHLNRIESICGEASETVERMDQFKTKMKELGYSQFWASRNLAEEKFVFLMSRTNIDKHFNIKDKNDLPVPPS